MTIHIPKPVAFALGLAAVALVGYVLYEEAPPLYRYMTKFEAM
jgi:hypothetical protein